MLRYCIVYTVDELYNLRASGMKDSLELKVLHRSSLANILSCKTDPGESRLFHHAKLLSYCILGMMMSNVLKAVDLEMWFLL